MAPGSKLKVWLFKRDLVHVSDDGKSAGSWRESVCDARSGTKDEAATEESKEQDRDKNNTDKESHYGYSIVGRNDFKIYTKFDCFVPFI